MKNKLVPLSARGHYTTPAISVSKSKNKARSVFIAVPNMGKIQTDLMLRLIQWCFTGKNIIFPPQRITPVSKARTICVEAFLKSGYEWLFFVDADTVPPEDAIDRLTSHHKQFVSGIVSNLKAGSDGILRPTPCVYRKPRTKKEKKECEGMKAYYPVIDFKDGKLKQIAAAGLACAMIHRSVFDKIKPPYFEEHYPDPKSKIETGEDIRFSQKLEAAGIKMYVDPKVMGAHWKEVKIDQPYSFEVHPDKGDSSYDEFKGKFEGKRPN